MVARLMRIIAGSGPAEPPQSGPSEHLPRDPWESVLARNAD